MRTPTTITATLAATALVLTSTVAGATSASASTKPGKPGYVTAQKYAHSYKLTWTKAAKHGSKITGYQVGDRTWSFGKKKWNTWKLTTVSAKKRAKTTSAAAWSKHQGRVRARNANGWGPWSPARTVTFSGTLRPPQGLTAETSIRAITLSWWNPNPAGAAISSYRVYSRPSGASTWTMRSTKAQYATYTGLTENQNYQFYVTATGSRGTTKASSVLSATPKPPVATTLTGWNTTPVTLNFGDQPAATYTLKSAATEDSVPVIEEARRDLGDGTYGPWQTMDRKAVWTGAGSALLIVPGPGSWEVRLRTLPTNDTLPTSTAARHVTMGEPTCVSSQFYPGYDLPRTQCEISVRAGTAAAQHYVIEYPGNGVLAEQHPNSVGVYFHGDTNDPRMFEGDTKTWVFGNGAVVIDAVSPLLHPSGLPAWGRASSGDVALGLATGRDIRAFNTYFGTTETFYWGHSGGSWFLASTYIPTGGEYAPGPLALDCGAGEPQPLGTRPIGDGTYGWQWTWNPRVDTTTRGRLAIQFNYGDQDFLVPSITAATAYYNNLGFTTTSHIWPGVPHCGKDFSPENKTWIADHINAF